MAILYVGIDLAKNVLAVHGVDGQGKAVPASGHTAAGYLRTLLVLGAGDMERSRAPRRPDPTGAGI